MTPNRITDPERACAFMQAGNATVTLRSAITGARFTFKVQAPMDDSARNVDSDFRFVKVLTGPDNENAYQYLGYIRGGVFFHGGAKSRINREALSHKVFAWTWQKIAQGTLPEQLEVWHEGRCGRCARKLTVPESIASGFGPECIEKVGGYRVMREDYSA